MQQIFLCSGHTFLYVNLDETVSQSQLVTGRYIGDSSILTFDELIMRTLLVRNQG